MKSLVINAALGLAWCLALTSMGTAQQAEVLSDVQDKTVPAVPVADAKQRLREAQKHLEQLSQGEWSDETRLEPLSLKFDVAVVEKPRDRFRAAVAEAFDARRQLQQSELVELERRIANIKRALQISDAMRETIIDQRTDEMLDQIEEGGKRGERGGKYPPGGIRPGYPRSKDGAATEPVEPDAASIKHHAELLALDVREAEANLEAAERAYQRVEKLFKSGAVEQAIFDEQADKYNRAQLQVERAEVELNAFTEEHDRGADAAPSADRDAAAADTRKRLAALDLKMAEANLAAAETRYERFKRHFADKAIDQSALDKQAAEYDRVKIAVKRAKAKLQSLATPPQSGDRSAEATTSSLNGGPIDQERIVWGRPAGYLQLGWDVTPRKKAYAPGDVLNVGLLIRNIGDQAIECYMPPSDSLERMRLDLTLLTVDGDKLGWEWGPAHKDRESLGRTERFRGRFAPGGVYGLPAFKLSLGEPADADGFRELMAGLDVPAGQTARLSFKLSPVDAESDEAIELQTEPFEFRVEAAGPASAGGRR